MGLIKFSLDCGQQSLFFLDSRLKSENEKNMFRVFKLKNEDFYLVREKRPLFLMRKMRLRKESRLAYKILEHVNSRAEASI